MALPLGGAFFFLRYGCHDQRHTESDSQQLCDAGRSRTHILKPSQAAPTGTTRSDDAKNRALISATRWIDTLNFYGDRCDDRPSVELASQ